MDEPRIGIRPEGDKGVWVFRIAVPGIGQILRGEVTVNTTLAEEELPIEVQKATAMEKVKVLADIMVKAATRHDDGPSDIKASTDPSTDRPPSIGSSPSSVDGQSPAPCRV